MTKSLSFAARRRKQFTRHPELVEAIVGPPTHWLTAFLDDFEQRPATPAGYRALLEPARLLHRAVQSCCGWRGRPMVRATRALGRAILYRSQAMRNAPHLKYVDQLLYPDPEQWQYVEWLVSGHPDWQPAVEADRCWLAERAAEREQQQQFEQRLDAQIAELHDILARAAGHPVLEKRGRVLLAELQHVRDATNNCIPVRALELAAMSPLGSA